jgi:ATPase subunit of ABC transporter with duplicated ATPase domains
MLTASCVSVRFGDNLILDSASFSINKHDCVGLVGPNGAGKSTLLAVLAGLRRPDNGSVSVMAGNQIGYLPQGFADLDGGTLQDLIDAHLKGLLRAHARFEDATTMLSRTGTDIDAAFEELTTATELFENRGGFKRLDELQLLLTTFGLAGIPLETPLKRLSGGEKTRAGLAVLLAAQPNLLLLDEPTNHLDVDGLQWLERFVASYDGAVMIVSHDRNFLDATTTRIFEIDPSSRMLSAYPGNYTAYREAKQRASDAQGDAYERQQTEIARIERDIRAISSHAHKTENATTNDFLRGRAKKVARTAKVRERKLERLLDSSNRLEKPERRWGLAVGLSAVSESGRDVVVAGNLSLEFERRVLFSGLDLHIRSGERIVLTGPNGAGKSSLLRILGGFSPPTSGSVRLGTAVEPGYFAQEQDTVALDRSALDQVRGAAAGEEGEARTFLHKFLFSGVDAIRPAGELSYGERARLALAMIVRRGANLLLLDEPLNHLDLPSRERFEEALLQFDGTTLMVLHDRYAIDRLAMRILELRDGMLTERFESAQSGLRPAITASSKYLK